MIYLSRILWRTVVRSLVEGNDSDRKGRGVAVEGHSGESSRFEIGSKTEAYGRQVMRRMQKMDWFGVNNDGITRLWP
jgi:hypothetical protein